MTQIIGAVIGNLRDGRLLSHCKQFCRDFPWVFEVLLHVFSATDHET